MDFRNRKPYQSRIKLLTFANLVIYVLAIINPKRADGMTPHDPA